MMKFIYILSLLSISFFVVFSVDSSFAGHMVVVVAVLMEVVALVIVPLLQWT